MKLYLVIHEQDTDAAWGCDVIPATSRNVAFNTMRDAWEKTVKEWEYEKHKHQDEDEIALRSDSAHLRDGNNYERWRIEEHEFPIHVAVEVCGGMVKNIYANAEVSADVFDLDVSDFPDKGEQDDADRRAAELKALLASPGWHNIW